MGLLMEQSVATQKSQAEDLELENKHLTASTSSSITSRSWPGCGRTAVTGNQVHALVCTGPGRQAKLQHLILQDCSD